MIHISPLEKVGLEFSDTTLRFIRLKKQREFFVPVDFAEIPIPVGCLRDGSIVNSASFIKFLSEIKKKYSLTAAYIALPSNAIKIVSGLVDAVSRVDTISAIQTLLETKTALPIKDMISAKRLVLHTKKGRFVQLVAAKTTIVQDFLNCFTKAGITPLSFEYQAQAQTAAILSKEDTRPILMVRIDKHQTTLAIVIEGSVVDTSTLDEGHASVGVHKPGERSLTLITAINNYYIQWHSNKEYKGVFDTVKTVYLTGEGAAEEGYADFMSATLKLPVVEGNTWANCFSFETMIPPLTRIESLRYATVVGLALGGGAMSVLPQTHKKHLKRKKLFKKFTMILVSFLLGVSVGLIVAIVLFVTKLLPSITPIIHRITSWI